MIFIKHDVELVLNQYDAIVIGAAQWPNERRLPRKGGAESRGPRTEPYIGGATVSREL